MISPIKRLAVLASGSGTNAQNIMETALGLNELEVALLITDNPQAKAIERAEKFNVPSFVIEKRGRREEHEEAILKMLTDFRVDWILLAGYMRILSQEFLSEWYDSKLGINRVVNIHPSLLPDYPGLNSYERAFADGVKKYGCSLHFVDSGIDTGEIIEQLSLTRIKTDSIEQFKQKGMALEYVVYSKFLKDLAGGKYEECC